MAAASPTSNAVLDVADFVLVLVTVPDAESGDRIARALLDGRLAACVNRLGPVRSFFRWEGKIESADEFLLVIKARRSALSQLETRVRELHPYQVPEVISLPLAGGSETYLRWLAAETLA